MKKTALLKKKVPMNKNRFANRMAVAAGFIFLCLAPGLTRAQSTPPGPVETPPKASPTARPQEETRPTDDFAGLTFTDEQKARIDQIHQNMKSRMDAVVKDEKLSADQKTAMLVGFRRLDSGEVFKALTPEQQSEVRKKVLARRAAEKEAQEKKKPSLPK